MVSIRNRWRKRQPSGSGGGANGQSRLIISTRDDGYGTYASAQYTASRIAGAKFIGFEAGGHTWVGHDDEIQAEIVKLLIPQARP